MSSPVSYVLYCNVRISDMPRAPAANRNCDFNRDRNEL